MSTDQKRTPVRPRFGRVPGFSERPQTPPPGACPTCGAVPPCQPPSSKKK